MCITLSYQLVKVNSFCVPVVSDRVPPRAAQFGTDRFAKSKLNTRHLGFPEFAKKHRTQRGPTRSPAAHRVTRENDGRTSTEMRPYELCGRAQVSTYAAAAGRIAATPSTPEPAPHRAAPGGGVEKFWIFVDSLQMGPDRSAFCPTGVHFAGGGGKFRPACGPPTRGGSMTESARREQSSPPCRKKP